MYPNLQRRVFAGSLYQKNFDDTISADLIWSVGSVMFVFLYIMIHLGSLFLAVVAMMMILLSFPVTQFIYTAIIRISFNADLNQLTLFIIMGIAADNFFVFSDAWK